MTPPSPSAPDHTPSDRDEQSPPETARVGIYLTLTEFEHAKGGYLADWQAGGHANTFARWVAAALETHAARDPRQRAELATPRPRGTNPTGSPRSFTITSTTVNLMRTAIAEDQHAGRWPTVSAWCAEAIGLAVQTARTRAGGTLPTPPARLPNRLVRPTSESP